MVSDDKAKWAVLGGFQAMRQADAAKRAKGSAVSDYERGLRRGMAIARDYDGSGKERDVDWDAATEQMEREIEEAKR